MECQIASAIEGIKDRLPAFKTYRQIYGAENDLEVDVRRKIISAYTAFIGLAGEIVKYYFLPAPRKSDIQLTFGGANLLTID